MPASARGFFGYGMEQSLIDSSVLSSTPPSGRMGPSLTRERIVTQPIHEHHGNEMPNRSRWRLSWRFQFGLGSLFLLVMATAIGLSWVTRADRFYDVPRVYGFTESTADGQPRHSVLAFVLQHRFFSQHRRLQWVVFLDLRPNQPIANQSRAILEMKQVGRYEVGRHGNCDLLSIPDAQSKYGWALCVEQFAFGSGAVFDIGDLRDPGPDGLQRIVNGAFALKMPPNWPILTWDELMAFIKDPDVDAWNADSVQRWKAETH
jgi:hypothetical protein